MKRQQLGRYSSTHFDRGRAAWVEALWLIASVFVASSIPGNQIRIWLLRCFGARLGAGVVIKPGVRVKFPWRLAIGDDTWIGEGAWLDNLAEIAIGSNCCVSQGVYICTGNHDWAAETFDLITRPVYLEDGSWIGAFARLAPGVRVAEDAVVSMGAVVVGDVPSGVVVSGNPAAQIRER